ncbi:two-component hybrid sensor and regulator [Janthinobacterium sp. BJB412]|nr:two-component hybrid sensor and regulator [Janthinobacterium sp. BJB412]
MTGRERHGALLAPGATPLQRAEQDARAAREALRLSEERMRNMLESITDGFAVIERDWRIGYLNAQAEEILRPPGAAPLQLPGQTLWQAFPALCGGVLERQFRQALAQRQTVAFELYYAPRQRWLEVRAYPSAEGLTATLQDITQRKLDERALRDSAERLQVALAAGKLGDWLWHAASDLVTLGRRAAAILDLPAEQPLAWPQLRARLLEADREPARRAFFDAFAKRSDCNIECRIERGDGERRWLSVVGHANFGDDGVLHGMTGMVQDISARKAADDSLRQREAELRALADSIPQLAWIARADGSVAWYNERWYAYTGAAPGQVAGDGWQDSYEPSCREPLRQRWQQSLRSGAPFEMEVPIRGADGHYRWFLTRANPVRDSTGQLLRWFGTSTDVDQVKRVQEALRDESNVLELLNSTGNALASTRDLRPLLQEVTDAATRISGARFGAFFYHGAEAGAGAAARLLHTLSGRPPAGFAAACQEGGALFGSGRRGEGTVRSDDLRRDARYQHCGGDAAAPDGPAMRSYLAVPVLSRAGGVVGSMVFGHPEPGMFGERSERILGGIAAQAGVAIDNARLYEAAQQAAEERRELLDSERRARAEVERTSQLKDEFLATLSHELRTPLTAILGWAQVLRRGSRDQADLHRGLQTIERNARAQAQLIEDLLDMSRITSGKVLLEMRPLAPLGVLEAAIETVRPTADAKGISIGQRFAPRVGPVMADPNRLQQILWNLLSNALKFTPRDGAVHIAMGEADGQVEITVADSGIGIAAAFLPHVFERFRQADSSTTRQHGGLGLGLSIVKHLAEQHGGTVAAASAGAGRGASFTLRLPLAARPAGPARPPRVPGAAAPQAAAAPRADLAGLRVLVVDDEADTRQLIQRILSDCNARVRTAASAAEALALLRGAPCDLLLSDIGMPDVDGHALLERVRALGPAGAALPAIALSALARSEDRIKALQSGFRAHLTKPVEPAALIAAVAGARPA